MRRVVLSSLIALLACAGGAVAEPDPMAVEAALVRSLLERAAFNACAALLPDAAEHLEVIARSWAGDLDEVATLLSDAGAPTDFVASLPARFDLAAATPDFASPERLQAYCAIVGDWPERFYVFQYSLPQFAIREIAGR